MEPILRQAVSAALQQAGLPVVDFAIEHPKILEHGDYACNVGLVLAKQVGRAPVDVAAQLRAILSGTIPSVSRIEIAGPGFLNFYLARNFLSSEIERANTLSGEWGKNTNFENKKIVVEYTDPNPFKEFHVGHLFTNAVGESIARLFMMAHADVRRVCYQGDVGLHVAYAIWGMQKRGISAENTITPKELGRAYATGATAYKNDQVAQLEIRTINKAVYERSDEAVNRLYDKGRDVSLRYFETIYARVGTEFSEYFFESEAGPKGKQLVLDNPTYFPESEGARVFAGEQYGLHTRVFLNKESLPTYEAKELALAKIKEERLGGYDYSIISTANEINEYFKVLLKAMSVIYPELAEKTEHIGHGMVRLATGKMSSRTGDVISAIDFIDDVAESARERVVASGHTEPSVDLSNKIAIAAIKYATLKGSIYHDSVFDKEKALSFEGDSGPYLQYTYARARSVIEKATLNGIEMSVKTAPVEPYTIEKLLYRFPEVVEVALAERPPHLVVTYLTELAAAFNSFYAHEQIANPSDQYAPYKVALTSAVATTLKNGLWTLGIEAPEQM
jgi:arginyl-tRNA synthetase